MFFTYDSDCVIIAKFAVLCTNLADILFAACPCNRILLVYFRIDREHYTSEEIVRGSGAKGSMSCESQPQVI